MDGQSGTLAAKPQTPGFVQLTAGIAALAGLLFGFDTGIISGAVLFIKNEFHLGPLTEEILVSAALIGAVCGCILSGRVTDGIGRRSTILITAGVFSVGSIISAIAPNVGLLVVGRLAVGLAIGVASYTAPLYIGEIAPPNLRGGLVTLNQLAITVGILLSYVVDVVFAPPKLALDAGFGCVTGDRARARSRVSAGKPALVIASRSAREGNRDLGSDSSD